jgi:2-methylaconitate cis-trans-isomerase PrpF
MDYSATIGAVSGRLLPTGRVVDKIVLEDGPSLEATLCNVANPCVFIAGAEHDESSMDLRARLLFVNRCHDSMAGTGATCLAAASRVPGSVARRVLTDGGASSTLRIGHPLGVMDVVVTVDADSRGDDIRFTTLGFARTARRLMAGQAYLPMQAS